MIEDYLACETLIIERLKDQVPDLRSVLGVEDLATIPEASLQTPAVFVVHDGDTLPGADASRAGGGAAQVVLQRWLVVVVVRNVQDTRGGAGTRRVAGPLIAQVITALAGWQPSSDFRPLRRINAPRPSYSKGLSERPLMFEAQLMTN